MRQTVSIIISGRVQGVYYRQSTRREAISIGISGFVKNLPDGTVQVLATGTADQLEIFIAWCRQGPPLAEVTQLEITSIETQESEGFIICR